MKMGYLKCLFLLKKLRGTVWKFGRGWGLVERLGAGREAGGWQRGWGLVERLDWCIWHEENLEHGQGYGVQF